MGAAEEFTETGLRSLKLPTMSWFFHAS
jgi:hypothetical protein